ncbi:MAG: GerAB/ArcD/ProY family transporter [Bacillota bacterium]
MIKEGKFGTHEAVSMLAITIIAKAFHSSPSAVADKVGTAGWYMTLTSSSTAFVALVITFSLLGRYPGKNLMDTYIAIFGKFVGKLFALPLLIVLFFTAAVNLREFVDILNVYIFPESPPSYLILLFMTIVAALSFMGLEIIARYSKLVAYILLTGYVALLILSLRLYRVDYLFPILGHGLRNTVINGLQRSSAYGEIIIAGIIVNSLNGTAYAKRAAYIGLAIAGIIISSALLAFSLVFPYFTSREITAPIYLMSSLIEYGKFIQRIEPLFFFIWNTSTVISIAVYFYISMLIYSHIFNIDDKRPVIIPLAVILVFLSLYPARMTQVTSGLVGILRDTGWIFFFVPPTLAFIVSLFKGKGGKSSVA